MRHLVRALEDEWQTAIDAVLRPLALADVKRLGPLVAELSRAYNAGEAEGARTKLPLEARIAFSFPRDVPKGAAAVRELVSAGMVAVTPERPLRVLDLGAGLGAMTWGIARALAAAGQSGRVDALLVDEDRAVLQKAEAIARVAPDGPVRVGVETAVASVGSFRAPSPFDVAVFGQVLSEIDPQGSPETRLEKHAALATRVLREMVSASGALVIVEPALRNRTRQLHALRDHLLASGELTAFAPCLHASGCPALAVDGEWCHEDLDVDLPEWLVPVARAAGLRYQGLTFSYLVLRKDGKTFGAERPAFRMISNLLRTKGKAELVTCGDDGLRRKIRQLDRDRTDESPFLELRRGDIATIIDLDDRGRVGPNANVRIDVGAPRK